MFRRIFCMALIVIISSQIFAYDEGSYWKNPDWREKHPREWKEWKRDHKEEWKKWRHDHRRDEKQWCNDHIC